MVGNRLKHWILVGQTPIEVDYREWADWFEKNLNERIIKQETITTGVGTHWVSTVFLGIDHSYSLAGLRGDPNHIPDLFETMVFCRDDHDDDLCKWADLCWRSRSYLEAQSYHDSTIIDLMKGDPPT
jgi:hypothetical protein